MAGFSATNSILLVSALVFINFEVSAGQRVWQKSLTQRPSVHVNQNSGAFVFTDQKLQGNIAALLDALWIVVLCLTPLRIVMAIILHRDVPEQPQVIHESVSEPTVLNHITLPGILWHVILIGIAAVCIVAIIGVVLQLSSSSEESRLKARVGSSRSKKSNRHVARNMRTHTVSTTASSMSGESAWNEKIVRRPGAVRRMCLLRSEAVNPDPNSSAAYAKPPESKQQVSEMVKLWASRDGLRNTEAAPIATQPERSRLVSLS